jgi:hypothetical protein
VASLPSRYELGMKQERWVLGSCLAMRAWELCGHQDREVSKELFDRFRTVAVGLGLRDKCAVEFGPQIGIRCREHLAQGCEGVQRGFDMGFDPRRCPSVST